MSSSEQQKIATVREMADAWAKQDWRKVGELFAPDGVLHSMMVDPVVGREAIYERISGLGAGIDEIVLDIDHIGVIDGRVYVERWDRFTFKGKKGEVPVVGVISFGDDNLISEWREYYDRAHLLREMGVEEFDHNGRG
jgi:limonene-1,2-epoxide hydrolase